MRATVDVTSSNPYFQKTRSAVLWTSMLSVPLLAIYNFLGVILYRDLHGTPFQVTVLTMLKPVVAIFSLYWSFSVAKRQDRLMPNLLWAGVLGRAPFFLFPFIGDPWLVLVIAGCYWMLSRGGIPAWMEVLKQNLPQAERGPIFSSGSAFAYLEGVLLAIGMGLALDHQPEAWRWIFPLSAIAGLVGVFIQSRVPVRLDLFRGQRAVPTASWKEKVINPWQDAFELLRVRADFRWFQWGYMLSGFGMMVIQPALPIFFVDVLQVSYTELAIALTICKGLGFAVTSPFWGRWLNRTDVFLFSFLIFALVALFPFFLMAAPAHIYWLYFAYFIYGVGQAGSELCWHLSGPIFAKDQDSSLFSGVNVMMVGLRGVVAPPLGIVLCLWAGPQILFSFGAVLCLISGVFMYRCSKLHDRSVAAVN